LRQASQYAVEGRSLVVDLDLEKFFDRVQHDVLMARVSRRVKDKWVLAQMARDISASCSLKLRSTDARAHFISGCRLAIVVQFGATPEKSVCDESEIFRCRGGFHVVSERGAKNTALPELSCPADDVFAPVPRAHRSKELLGMRINRDGLIKLVARCRPPRKVKKLMLPAGGRNSAFRRA
jgi:hypothetical protein